MAPMVENRGPELVGVNAFFVTTAIIASALRCYVRAGMVKAFGRDDWLMVLALLFFVFYISFSTTGVHYGTGRHHDDLEKQNVQRALECWWYCYLFYALTMITSKMSIAYFLLRIAARKLHIWIIYAAMLFTVLAGVVFFFVTLFQCLPVSYFWNKDQKGNCISVDVVIALAYLYSAFSVVSDLTFAVLPAFLVWNLQLKTRAKLALIPLLVMGCVASSALFVRFGYLMRLSDPDFLWATVDIAIWSTVEMGLAITAGSLATLRPLVKLVGFKLGMTSDPSRLRMTDDVARRPSAFMNSNHGISASSSASKPAHATKTITTTTTTTTTTINSGVDAYGLSAFPCKCCGQFKCQHRSDDDCGVRVEASSGQKRSSSLGFKLGFGKENTRELARVNSNGDSEEELHAGGRPRQASHGAEGVVPKSFLFGNGQKE